MDLLVDLSIAVTFNIPLESISKVTSICGVPLGAGGIPSNWKSPNLLLSLVNVRSPSYTCINTPGWLSAYVENVCDFFVGIVVFLGISLVITPPAVSKPILNGATSNNNKSLRASSWFPLKIEAWTAAPYATASSGLIDLHNSLPLKNSDISFCTLGMRVEPPTNTTSSILFFDICESRKTFSTGAKHLVNTWLQRLSNLALDSDEVKSIPSYNESISTVAVVVDERVLLALSQAVLSLRIDLLFLVKSLRCFLLNSCAKWFTIIVSKSSPPKCVSPAVAFTSNTPSSIFNIDTSNVPPPISKINTFFSSFFLSIPYAIAAAVGSLIILKIFNPAILPASLVACLCESLK